MNDRTGSVVVDTSQSPRAALRAVGVRGVALDDAFWAPRLTVNRATTIPAQHRMLEETGRLENFRRLTGASAARFAGIYFNDSDLYKWLEAASWALSTDADPPLSGLVDETIALIAAAQRPDGYLNTYFALDRAGER